MCDADASIITYSWVKGHAAPHPNFNVEHKCRDFGAVLQYARKQQLDPEDDWAVQGHFIRPAEGDWKDFDEPPFDPLADE